MLENVFVICLKRNFRQLQEQLTDVFSSSILFCRGVDGDAVPSPANWTAGPGMWGCYRSHMQILEHCLQYKINSYLVFEDDAVMREDWLAELKLFLEHCPQDWDQVYLGGQLIHDFEKPPEKVNEHVYRPFNVNRTHAMGVHRRGYAKLYQHLFQLPFATGEAFDAHLGRLHESGTVNVYCPRKWIVGQAAGTSQITGLKTQEIFWLDPQAVYEAHEMRKQPPTLIT